MLGSAASGWSGDSRSRFVALTAYQAMLGVPMVAIGLLTNTIQRGIASGKRMLEVFTSPKQRCALPQRGGQRRNTTPLEG